ncbi:MAG: hypothetical protein ACI8QD_002892 [Cyclobacteriaceae bacterium]
MTFQKQNNTSNNHLCDVALATKQIVTKRLAAQ